jgi:hypothetical protein
MKFRILGCLFILAFMAGCATAKQEKKVADSLDDTINCPTAEGDIRALESEKKHANQQAAAGVQAIVPVSAIVHMVQGTEGTQFKVMTGDYDKAIDKRIAQIKEACGLE